MGTRIEADGLYSDRGHLMNSIEIKEAQVIVNEGEHKGKKILITKAEWYKNATWLTGYLIDQPEVEIFIPDSYTDIEYVD